MMGEHGVPARVELTVGWKSAAHSTNASFGVSHAMAECAALFHPSF